MDILFDKDVYLIRYWLVLRLSLLSRFIKLLSTNLSSELDNKQLGK